MWIFLKNRKALSYTALSCMGLTNACFLIGSKKVWDTWIYVVKTLCGTFFDDLALTLLSNSSCNDLSYTSFFIPQMRQSSYSLFSFLVYSVNNTHLCPIHVVSFTLISNLATDYIQKRRGQAFLFSFEFNLSPNLISM